MKNILLLNMLLLIGVASVFSQDKTGSSLDLMDNSELTKSSSIDQESFVQGCNEIIVENESNAEGKQLLKTVTITLVSRGNYRYQIELMNHENGVTAKVFSVGGVSFNKGDELVFMDSNNQRIFYKFIGTGETTVKEGKDIHFNILQLNTEAIEWFASTPIKTIYIKDNRKNEMRKFTLSGDHSAGFKKLATCFDLSLIKRKIRMLNLQRYAT